ncbi:hypothetical protein KZP23_10550 [Echinicola marina]|uniref:hypothetical protein n=1 Tax=Echinicola marina TaxID=2859768 RepID=UPI001CF6948D|nr:hypothetical protein [Echinicola marina]UCS95412.1 hypothetical protein KZP23_10550 [Echinicola marina]
MKDKLILTSLFLLVLYLLPQTNVYAQQILLKSAKDSSNIPFAVFAIPEMEIWRTTNERGAINLDINTLNNKEYIYISALGYQDSTISVSEFNGDKNTIFLHEKMVNMPSVTIESEKLVSNTIGDEHLPIATSGANTTTAEGANPYRYASYVQFRKRNTKLLSTLWVYLSKNGDRNISITLRVLVSDKVNNPKEGLLYDVSDFYDIIYKNAYPIKLTNYGWNKIDLEKFNIRIPANYKGVFLIFDVVNLDKDKRNNLIIPFQDKSKESLSAAIYWTKTGKIGVLDKRRDHFAVKLEYLY